MLDATTLDLIRESTHADNGAAAHRRVVEACAAEEEERAASRLRAWARSVSSEAAEVEAILQDEAAFLDHLRSVSAAADEEMAHWAEVLNS